MSHIKYLFVTDPQMGAPLENGEGIMVLDPEGANYVEALISNEIHQSLIYAPEINWYLKQSTADALEQKEVLKKLYQMRYIRYKHAPKETHTQVIDRTLLVVGESEAALRFVEKAARLFETIHLLPSKLLSLEGHFGAFAVRFLKSVETQEGMFEEQEVTAQCAQVVFWDTPCHKAKQRGVECVVGEADVEALALKIRNRIGYYAYTNALLYESSVCGFHQQECPSCEACVNICPVEAITKDSLAKELRFSPLECTACGLCVGACPSAALDFAPFTREAFAKVAKLCESTVVVVVSEHDLQALNAIALPSGVMPLVVDNLAFISAEHIKALSEATKVVVYATTNKRHPLSCTLPMDLIVCEDPKSLHLHVNDKG